MLFLPVFLFALYSYNKCYVFVVSNTLIISHIVLTFCLFILGVLDIRYNFSVTAIIIELHFVTFSFVMQYN